MSDDDGKANDPRRHELRADAANALAPADWLSQAADRKAKHILMTGLVDMAREIMSEKHSPGPWTLSKNDYHQGDEIRDARGAMVISACVEDYGGAGASLDISEADARLICEAPAMLEMLRNLEWVSSTDDFVFCDECGEQQQDGHRPGCKLAALLARVDG